MYDGCSVLRCKQTKHHKQAKKAPSEENGKGKVEEEEEDDDDKSEDGDASDDESSSSESEDVSTHGRADLKDNGYLEGGVVIC